MGLLIQVKERRGFLARLRGKQEESVATYYLYFLTRKMVTGEDRIEAENDEHAMQLAASHCGEDDRQQVEVWDGHSRIGVVTIAALELMEATAA